MRKKHITGVVALMLLLGMSSAWPSASLIAYYSFEALSGTVGETVIDQSGRGHHGICRQNQYTAKAPNIVAGPTGLGDALHFDGAFYIEIPNHYDFNCSGSITVAAWISVDGFSEAWATICCRGDWSWRLHRRGSSDNAAFHQSGLSSGYGVDGFTTNIRSPKRWVHLVGTYQNGVGASLYINGGLEASDPGSTGYINTSGSDPVTIGAQIDNGTLRRFWRGQIDEVRIYNGALSAAEVTNLYQFVITNGNIRPILTPPSNQVWSEAPLSLQLSARVEDDGLPLPAHVNNPDLNDPNKLRWNWSVISVPSGSAGVVWSGNPTNGEAFTYAGSSNAPGTVFTCNPTATFDVPGLYLLQFSASDGEKSANSQVRVVVRSTCNYRSLGYRYLSPVPEAEYVSAQTRFILVRFSEISPTSITNLATFISVTGPYTGVHTGQTRIAADGQTVIFTMTSYFTPYELVTVTLNPQTALGTNGTVQPYQYRFMVAGRLQGSVPGLAAPASSEVQSKQMTRATTDADSAPSSETQGQSPQSLLGVSPGKPGIMPNGVSVPGNFPHINITVNDNPDPGFIFLDNRTSGTNAYNVIFDNTGSPIWYWNTGEERRDMKVQQNGVLTMLARSGGMRFIGLNSNYQEIATYRAVNGYETDEHELVVLANGTYFLIGLCWNTVDMSQYVFGGNPNASVGETVLQEFTAAGELIFQWRAWDHYDIRDLRVDDPMSSSMRFPHFNSIDLDDDGQIVLSSRHFSEVTKINRDTGQLIWRLGGTHSDFTFTNDSLKGFESQHAVRATGAGRYLMFDNGNLHSPPVSRSVEYELDHSNKTARLVWQYPASPNTSFYSWYMANSQRLPNGNTLINWAVGPLPKLMEVRPDGTKAFEMNWIAQYEAYRVWRCPWQGMALKPNLIIEAYPDKLVLLFNKFGDTNVAYYRIYGGTTPNPTNELATSPVTLATLNNLQNQRQYYFRVTAVDRTGAESLFSDEKSVSVNLIRPGQNMVLNGDFSQSQSSWTFALQNTGAGTWSPSSGAAYIDITNPGIYTWDVQLRQAGMKLVQGRAYTLAFDAWSSAGRMIEVRLAQDQSPFTLYQSFNPTLSPVRQRFTYSVTPTTTDLNARLVFNVGGASADVYLDNVVLFDVAPGDFNRDQSVNYQDLSTFTGQWLRRSSGLSADLNNDGKVDFLDFVIFGENWSGLWP